MIPLIRQVDFTFKVLLFVLYWIDLVRSSEDLLYKYHPQETKNSLEDSSNMLHIKSSEDLTDSVPMPRMRIKRQSGGGKYTEAAKMEQTKVMQLIMQMFRNMWDIAHVGGSHPLHPDVPKPVVLLYKDKFLSFFFPNKADSEQ